MCARNGFFSVEQIYDIKDIYNSRGVYNIGLIHNIHTYTNNTKYSFMYGIKTLVCLCVYIKHRELSGTRSILLIIFSIL
jgi:hypothetical protein